MTQINDTLYTIITMLTLTVGIVFMAVVLLFLGNAMLGILKDTWNNLTR